MIDLLIYILTGLGLSADAFSVAISYGTIISKHKEKIIMTLLIGLFHFIMPIFGTFIATTIKSAIIIKTKYIAFLIFSILIIGMIKDLNNNEKISKVNLISIILVSLAVSIDSLSIGIVIGLSNNKIIAVSTLFSIISSMMTFIGINIGNKITKNNKNTANMLGIIILTIVAIKYLIFG